MIRSTLLATLVMLYTSQALGDQQRTDIHPTAEEAMPLMAGMSAPEFTVRTTEDEAFHFDPENMDKPVVLTFFRGGWCPYCNLHLAELRHAEAALKELGFDVWFASMDQPSVLAEGAAEDNAGYTMLSDAKLEATRAFGIAWKMPDELVERYLGYDIDVEAISGESHHVMPVPATFIIGEDGMINFAYANPSYQTRLHPDVLVAAAKAYRADADQRLRKARQAQREAAKDS